MWLPIHDTIIYDVWLWVWLWEVLFIICVAWSLWEEPPKVTIWNRTSPSVLVQNQHTRELINARNMSHKHNNKDPSLLRYLSPGVRVNTRYSEDVPLVEFMYVVFTRMPGETPHRRPLRSLLCLCDVFRVLINSLCVVCWYSGPSLYI